MQGVKPDATTVRVVYRVCQQVVEIDQHGGHHQQIGELPVPAKKQGDDDRRNDEVQGKV